MTLLNVLAVCTHNRTRSVMMGALLTTHLEAVGIDVEVRTAGTRAEGKPAMDRAVRILHDHGVDVSDHLSTAIDAESVHAADLIVTAEQAHVVDIAGQWPDVYPRTYTLPELVERAHIAGPRGDRTVAEWLGALAHDREDPIEYLDSTGIPEVADPTGHSPAMWDACFAELDQLARRLAKALA